MVNDPSLEREDVGGDEPMGDPAETGTRVGRGGDLGVGPEGGNVGVEEEIDDRPDDTRDETLT
jgi:hypothetical protein